MPNRFSVAVWIFLGSFFFFLIGNNNHAIWDRDEPRYCQATREMLVTGDWIVPHFNGGIRYDKPPLTYWMMAGPMWVFGINEFAARFPAALMGACRTTLIFFFALAMSCSLRGAIIAAGASAFMALLVVISKAATTDSILLFTVVLAMYAFWRLLTRPFDWWNILWLGAAFGFSILVKGPPGIAVVALAAVAFFAWNKLSAVTATGRGRNFLPVLVRGLAFLAVLLAIVLPWVIAVSIKTDGEFLRHSIGRHVVDRVREPMEGHQGPFFYYLLLLPLLIFPLTPLAINAVAWASRRAGTLEMRFLWCWLLPGFVMFSAVSTKLPHYVAPLLPAIGLMIGLWWTAQEKNPGNPQGIARGVGALFMSLIGVGAAVALPMGVRMAEFPFSLAPFVTLGVVLAVGMVIGSVYWMLRRDNHAVVWWAGGWGAALLVAMLWVLPTIDAVRGSKTAAEWLHKNLPPGTEVYALDYQEPSLVFYWGHGIRIVDRSEKGWMRPLFWGMNDIETPRAVVMTGDRYDKFEIEYDEYRHPQVRAVYREKFYQFEQGRWMEIVVMGNWAEGEPAP